MAAEPSLSIDAASRPMSVPAILAAQARLRTGDRDHLRQDGYQFLTGRKKHMINRGGERISPLEVEEALLVHPAVQDAAVFPMPDGRLGEDVAAVVVPCPGMEAGEDEVICAGLVRLPQRRPHFWRMSYHDKCRHVWRP